MEDLNVEQENKRKRARSENWVAEDKVLLKELVKERVGVLENKNTDTKSNKRKLAGWADLQNRFNSMCFGAKRTLTQLKNQWGHIKVEAKKTKPDQKRITQTGRDPPAPKPENVEGLEAWPPQEFVDDFNEYESDQSNQTPHHVKNDNNTETDDPLLVTILEAELAEQEDESADEPRPVKKRKKNNMTAEEQIVAVEIKCRKQLHEAQMRNEKIKNENLIREQQILQIKAAYYKRKLESFNKTLY